MGSKLRASGSTWSSATTRNLRFLSVGLALVVFLPVSLLVMSKEGCDFGHRPEGTKAVGVESTFWSTRCTYELPDGTTSVDQIWSVDIPQLALLITVTLIAAGVPWVVAGLLRAATIGWNKLDD